jgi:hypothetical protein
MILSFDESFGAAEVRAGYEQIASKGSVAPQGVVAAGSRGRRGDLGCRLRFIVDDLVGLG